MARVGRVGVEGQGHTRTKNPSLCSSPTLPRQQGQDSPTLDKHPHCRLLPLQHFLVLLIMKERKGEHSESRDRGKGDINLNKSRARGWPESFGRKETGESVLSFAHFGVQIY